MFYWGNFFILTLHVSGETLLNLKSKKESLLQFLNLHNYYICVNENQWQHHFEEDNYLTAAVFSNNSFDRVLEKLFLYLL